MSATFSSQSPSAAGQQAVPPGHSPHHGGPPGHAMHSGPPSNTGQMQGPVPNGMPGQPPVHHSVPPHSQYPGHHPTGPPSSISNGYTAQSGNPGSVSSGSVPSQQANPQVIQKVGLVTNKIDCTVLQNYKIEHFLNIYNYNTFLDA